MSHRPSAIPHSGAFTLLELLVVVAIISLLAALLLPALKNARASAKRAACLSNIRQISLAVAAYTGDYSGSIPCDAGPPANGGANLGAFNYWTVLTNRYLPAELRCPLATRQDLAAGLGMRYGQNGNLRQRFQKLANLKVAPDRAVLLGECYTSEPYAYVHYQITMWYEPYGHNQNHNNGLNFVFADFHAEYVRPILAPYIGGGNPNGSWAFTDPVYGTASNQGYFYCWTQPGMN